MAKETLHTWKEIARYVGQTVRTCQRWEKGLGFPVHRLEGYSNSRIYAYKEEIDTWLENTLHNKTQESNEKINPRKILLPAAGLLAAAVLIIAFSNKSLRPAEPADFGIDHSILTILDGEGKILGEFRADAENLKSEDEYKTHFQKKYVSLYEEINFPWIAVDDLIGNNKKEILFCQRTLDNLDDNKLFCLTQEGKRLWSFEAGEIEDGDEDSSNARFIICGFGIEDLDNDNIREIVVIAHSPDEKICQVVVLNNRGERLCSHLINGCIKDYEVYDLNDDDVNELLLGGINWEHENPACLILSAAARGLNQGKTENRQAIDCAYQILFPRHPLDEPSMIGHRINVIDLDRENGTFEFRNSVKYRLDRNLELTDISFGLRFVIEHSSQIKEGKTNLSLDEIKEILLEENLLYSNGSGWTRTPIRFAKPAG